MTDKMNCTEMASMRKQISFVMEAKKRMMATNPITVSAKSKCPFCEGTWHFRIGGRTNHIHAACDGPCNGSLIE